MEILSVDILLTRARLERETRSRLYEGLEGRAGVVLGFAGVVAALSRGPVALHVLGTALAAGAALATLLTLLPRLRTDLELREMNEQYASAEPAFTSAALLDALVGAWEGLDRALAVKAARLRLSIAMLASSVIIVATGQVLR